MVETKVIKTEGNTAIDLLQNYTNLQFLTSVMAPIYHTFMGHKCF